jgi:integrase
MVHGAAKLSDRTINTQMSLVRSILRFAVLQRHIAAAPTEKLGRGYLMLEVEETKLDPPIEKPEDVARLLEAIREIRPDRYAMFATLIGTGMRKGEACGLRWENVDFNRRIIKVRGSYAGKTKSKKHRDHRVREANRLSVLFKAPPTAKVLPFEAPGEQRTDSASAESEGSESGPVEEAKSLKSS